MGFSLAKIFGADTAVKDVVKSVGDGVGGLMDRVGFTKKMSESEKVEKTIQIIKATTESSQLDVDDLKSAREMAIVQMQTQKAGFITRFINGTLRPAAGWFALISITNKVWGQMLTQMFPSFTWEPITFDAMESMALTGILAFFFGFRQRSKEKGVALDK